MESGLGRDCGERDSAGDAVAAGVARGSEVLSALPRYERDRQTGILNPTTRAHHTEPEVSVPDSVTGMSGRTEGLLQLTYADAERYGCDFDWQTDRKLKANDPNKTILQPKNNLECGVKILYRLSSNTDHCFIVPDTGQLCSLDGRAIKCLPSK